MRSYGEVREGRVGPAAAGTFVQRRRKIFHAAKKRAGETADQACDRQNNQGKARCLSFYREGGGGGDWRPPKACWWEEGRSQTGRGRRLRGFLTDRHRPATKKKRVGTLPQSARAPHHQAV